MHKKPGVAHPPWAANKQISKQVGDIRRECFYPKHYPKDSGVFYQTFVALQQAYSTIHCVHQI
jgi:hypothetical protein